MTRGSYWQLPDVIESDAVTRSVKAEWCSSVTLYCAKHRFLPSRSTVPRIPVYNHSLSLSLSLSRSLSFSFSFSRRTPSPHHSKTWTLSRPERAFLRKLLWRTITPITRSVVRTGEDTRCNSTRIRRPSDWLCLLGKFVLHYSIGILDPAAIPHDLPPDSALNGIQTVLIYLYLLSVFCAFNE